MTTAQPDLPTSQKHLRLWPGIVAAVVLVLGLFGIPRIAPDLAIYSFMFGGLFGVLAFIVWWAFFSRAPRFERWGAFVLMIVVMFGTFQILHKSVATGMMGMMFFVYAIPALIIAFVGSALVTQRLSIKTRRVAMAAAILLACGVWTLVRTDGITGEGSAQFAWRWSPTSEERLLAQAADQPAATTPTPAVAEAPKEQPKEQPAVKADEKPAELSSAPATAETPNEKSKEQLAAKADNKPAALPPAAAVAEKQAAWPGFRGPHRDGSIHGVRIKTDWSASPPVEVWRRQVGPGWSSFAVRGNLFYTQEQRGNDEIVACYNLTTGKLVWRHRDAVRFWESNGGAGPRATPALSNGRVYAFGATGILNALDAGNGAVVWSRNVASDTGKKVPGWGFASSPLVVRDLVVVAAAGQLAAYDVTTGKQRWSGPAGGSGYSSPHLATIDGVEQILLLNGTGAISVTPTDGTQLWEYKWPSDGIVQPALTADGDLLIGTGSGMGAGAGVGIRRVSVGPGPGGWNIQERWTSIGLKPYYNDFVVHKGHAFGFDGSILACIDLTDGKRKWKGGRYGHGQLLLLPDQDLLLVLSEEGELALVGAVADNFTELARIPAIEGKTWNHPVVVGDIVLARNGEQMAAFRLPVEGR